MANLKEDVRQKIMDQLSWDNRLDIYDLEVDYLDGRLSLRGTVPSYDVIRAAEESAFAVPGIDSIDNSLYIRFPDDITVPTDEDIRSSIETGIQWNSSLNANAIQVQVNEGEVTLTGKVNAYWRKRLAEDIASATSGVIQIHNQIDIVVKNEVMDEAIQKDVEAAIDRNLNIKLEDIQVEVNDGVVTLKGTVPDFNASRAAYVSAIYTSGVNEVKNFVKVKTL